MAEGFATREGVVAEAAAAAGLLLALEGDPLRRAATAPLIQWVRMAWYSWADAELYGRGLGIGDLEEAWNTTLHRSFICFDAFVLILPHRPIDNDPSFKKYCNVKDHWIGGCGDYGRNFTWI